MPTRLCSTARCPDPATYRGYCTTHAQQRNRETHTNKSIYSSKRWQMLRRKVLFEEPLCSCGEIATDVDHIQPIERGGQPWSRANLQSMCHQCHSIKTNAEMRA
jgi:5-methylcytosine-specific restriction protein A